MIIRTVRHNLLVAVISLVCISNTSARNNFEDQREKLTNETVMSPTYVALQSAAHNVGKIVLTISNHGMFGAYGGGEIDPFTALAIPACEFPKGSGSRYLFAGYFWFGAVVGQDTLVSTGADGWTPPMFELYPDESPLGRIVKRSSNPSDPSYHPQAVSDQDYIAKYTDTFVISGGGVMLDLDAISMRRHKPLGIEVTQSSYAWAVPYAEDFILFDYRIKNIHQNELRGLYMGICVDGDVFGRGVDGNVGAQDDLAGFRLDLPTPRGFSGNCSFRDTVNLAYIFDNDADPVSGDLHASKSVPHVTGLRFVHTPLELSAPSFNWWFPNLGDFGPQSRTKFRPMGPGGGLGLPVGDANKYHQLRNGEIDYDQIMTGTISPADSIWATPNSTVSRWAPLGTDVRYLLSVGPFDISPGQELPLSFAYIAGEDFHTDPNNYRINLLAGNPSAYYDNLDFADLGLNSRWASWMYDNPGVDTDGDLYFGKGRFCYDSVAAKVDTLWYEGDGVPDYKGPRPPRAPKVWGTASTYIDGSVFRRIRVRFNGSKSETGRDEFTREQDFEGYNVYLSRDIQPSSFSKLESYDRLDFRKWTFRNGQWVLRDSPFTLQQLRDLYGPIGDPNWDPMLLFYDSTHLYINNPYNRIGLTDSIFYFEPEGANRSTPSATRIHRIYADTVAHPKPPDSFLQARWDPTSFPFPILDSATRAIYFTDDNYLKYYEYEYVIDGLLPLVPYYVNVTAFDYGWLKFGLDALETPCTLSPIRADTSCCVGLTGNVDGDLAETADLSDVMALASYLLGSTPLTHCAAEEDVNKDGKVDIIDVIILVNYLVLSRPLPVCP